MQKPKSNNPDVREKRFFSFFSNEKKLLERQQEIQ